MKPIPAVAAAAALSAISSKGKNKYAKKQAKRTLIRCQDFGEVLMAPETLYPTFESYNRCLRATSV